MDRPPVLVAGIELLTELGTSSNSTVYLGRCDGREVAVKILAARYVGNPEMVERLQREATALQRIDHPNVVKAYRFDTFMGQPFLAMEYVKGESLSARVKRLGPLPEEEVRRCAQGILAGLAAAHRAGYLHRDIQPANVFITEDGTIKLMDFGLARHEKDRAVTTGSSILGTPAFLAPEQARNEANIDIRADLYAVGITLFYLATGEIPFFTRNLSLLLTRKTTDDVPDVRQYRPDFSPAFAEFIAALCHRDRDRRPATPAKALEQLEPAPLARPQPPTTAAPAAAPKLSATEGSAREETTGSKVPRAAVSVPAAAEKPAAPPDAAAASSDAATAAPSVDAGPAGAAKGVGMPSPVGFSDPGFREPPLGLKADQILFYEDDVSVDGYLLLQGSVEVLRSGRQVAIIKEAGSFLGEMSPLLHAPRSATIRALTDAAVLKIDATEFRGFLERHPEMAYRLARDLAERLEETSGRLTNAEGRLDRIAKSFREIGADLEG